MSASSMKILKQGAPALAAVAEPVAFGEDVRSLVAQMFEAMRLNGGIGLAGNQVGVLKRVIVVNTGFHQAIINPVIVRRYGGQHTAKEGCLSFPGKQVVKVRDQCIRVEGFDENWQPVSFGLKGLTARVIQHEIDHLDGITIGDAVPGAA